MQAFCAEQIAVLTFALVCVATMPAAQQAPVAPQTAPASLTDQEFWALIAELSETSGNFHGDNFTSNEAFADNAARLASRRAGGAYLGVGPEQNFSYIVAVRPQIAFVIDIRRQAVVQHLMFKALFELSADRAEFIARLFSRPKAPGPSGQPLQKIWDTMPAARADGDWYSKNHAEVVNHLTATRGFALSAEDLTMLDYVHGAFFKLGPAINYAGFPSERKLTTGNTDFTKLSVGADKAGVLRSFLATESNFQMVKAMHANNLIVPVQGDFGGPKTLRAIGDYLRARSLLVNTFYISNVEQYLLGQTSSPTIDINGGTKAFHANLATLPIDDSSVLVRWPIPPGVRTTGVSVCSLAVFLKLPAGPKPAGMNQLRDCNVHRTSTFY